MDRRGPELTITEQANLHADELYDWLRDQKVDEVRDLASAFRIPNSPVGNGENVDDDGPLRRARSVHRPTRGMASSSRTIRTGCAGAPAAPDAGPAAR